MLHNAITATRPATEPFQAQALPPRDAAIAAIYACRGEEMLLIHALGQTAPPEMLDTFAASREELGVGANEAVRFIVRPGAFFLITERQRGLVMNTGDGAMRPIGSAIPACVPA